MTHPSPQLLPGLQNMMYDTWWETSPEKMCKTVAEILKLGKIIRRHFGTKENPETAFCYLAAVRMGRPKPELHPNLFGFPNVTIIVAYKYTAERCLQISLGRGQW